MQSLIDGVYLTLKSHQPCLISDSAQRDTLFVFDNVFIMVREQTTRDKEWQPRHVKKVFVKDVGNKLFRYFKEALETVL